MWLVTIGATAVVLLLGIIVWNLLVPSDVRKTVDHAQEVILKIEQLDSALERTIRAQWGFFLTRESGFLEQRDVGIQELRAVNNKFAAMTFGNPVQNRVIQDLRAATETRIRIFEETQKSFDAEGFEAARREFDDGRAAEAQMHALLEQAKNVELAHVERRQNEESFNISIVLTGLAVLIFLLPAAGVWVRNNLRMRLAIEEKSQALREILLKTGALQDAIFNSANFSCIATDAKGVIQIFNVGAENMLGYVAADVVDKITPADISDPQEIIVRAASLSEELNATIAPGFEALIFKASRGIEDIYELTYTRKDGTRLPAVVSVTALRDAQNTIIGYLLIGTDNTARRRAEEELLKAGALQSAIFNSANFSSIATDAKGVIQIFNVGAERMLGYEADDVMNKVTPAEISDSQEIIARARELSAEFETQITPGFEALVFKASRGIEDIYELTYIRKDGSSFPAVVSVTALRDAHNTIIGYLLIGTDNTARKQIEDERMKLDQRLRDQQFYTRSLIESNSDAIMTTDLRGIISDVNQQMSLLTGCTRDELIGAPARKFFTDPERAEEAIARVLREGKVTDYELTARATDGRETVVSYNATTLHDRDRTLQGVFAAARDITERAQFEHRLQETNEALELARASSEKANMAKSEFLSNMSHELRSPLNAVLGFAQLMASENPPPSERQQKSIDQILRSGWYLLRLINEILDLAVIESGKVVMSLESISVSAVLRECQSMIAPEAQKRGVQVMLLAVDGCFFVRADHMRLKQVFINLMSNAIKYNRAGGVVSIDCKMLGGRVRISVQDTGDGLAPEQIDELFQPFNRLGQESGAEQGTGIGLIVTKQLVELMGGSIGVSSELGSGSVFWIDLEASGRPGLANDYGAESALDSDDHDAANAANAADAAQRTLLYVEDNQANLNLVEHLIARRSDLRLLTAIDGKLGVQLARTFQPDVILMDINLPVINGYGALAMLRRDPATAHMPVIAVSANAMPRDLEKALTAGFFRYLTKPIMVDELMEVLDAALLQAAQDRPSGEPDALIHSD